MLYFIFHAHWSIFEKLQNILTLFSENDLKVMFENEAVNPNALALLIRGAKVHNLRNLAESIVHFGSLEKPTTLN